MSPFFFFNDPATTEIYTLSLHDALPISLRHLPFAARPRSAGARLLAGQGGGVRSRAGVCAPGHIPRSEEHTSELQSHHDLVCRLLLEKKKKKTTKTH